MGIDKNTSMSRASALRLRAETQLQMNVSETGFSLNYDGSQQLLHELQINQIELEMQNAELRQSWYELEKSLERSTDLYEFAPVGYFTLNRSGIITATNLRGAALLGVERSGIIGQQFDQFVMKEHRPAFTAFLVALYASMGNEACEVELVKKGKSPLFVQIEAKDCASGQKCRLALIDITTRKQAENDLRSYARRLIEMEEDLREKLATELHDEIGRDLTVIGMNLAVFSHSLTDDTPKNVVERVTDSSRLIEGISRTVRGIMVMLRPPVLDDYGLFAALRWHADLFTKRTGIVVSVQADDPFPRLMIAKEMALFRIAQEALMNASKHAATMEVIITVSGDNGMLYLKVTDFGKGFTPASFEQIQNGPGWGIKIMRERAELIGGNLHVDSAPGKGTVVSVNVPLEEM